MSWLKFELASYPLSNCLFFAATLMSIPLPVCFQTVLPLVHIQVCVRVRYGEFTKPICSVAYVFKRKHLR